MPTPRLDPEHTALLVIDVQEKLLPVIKGRDELVRRVGRVMDGFNALNLPILVTEQYRKGLGETEPGLLRRVSSDGTVIEKLKFSACIEPIRRRLNDLRVRSIVLVGIEAHVCVLQTALDLLDAGYVTAVALDAIGSRRTADQQAAVQRMMQVGVIPATVESVLFELVQEAGTEKFARVRGLIK